MNTPAVTFNCAECVTVQKCADITGLSVDAINAKRKRKRGDWLEGVVWFKAPDGKVYISMPAYAAWVMGSQQQARAA